MSNPSNVLADFQTYSYQHILIATDGPATVAAFRDSTNINDFRRPLNTSPADRYTPREIQNSSGSGRYVVLIDTSTDSKLAIESIKWETVIVPQRENDINKGQRYGNTIEVDGEIIIQEPHGMDLYQIMANAARDIGKAPASVIYILKTIFIGNHKDGTTETISTVRPFSFVLTDITSEIDTMGTSYRLEIVGMQNGVTKLPQHQLAAQGVTVNVTPGQTIAQAVATFEANLQQKYDDHVSSLYRQLDEPSEILNRKFQRVRYTFKVDPIYATAEYIAGTAVNDSLRGVNGSATLTTGPNGTIESMLHKIMNSCARVDQDGIETNNPDSKSYLYKLVSTVVPSEPDEYVIQYEIHRYEMIKQDQNGELIEPKPGEFIEFDYIYTGRNIDVLSFNMKFDFGLTFFLTVATAPNLPRSAEEWKSGVKGGAITGSPNTEFSSDAVNPVNAYDELRTPLFLSTKVDDPLIRNKVDSLTAGSYEELFKRHAALEHVEASITIAGNPNLLDELVETVPPVDTEVVPGNTGGTQVTRTPALVKVNVLFPEDTEVNGVKQFWYNGYYHIYSITQNFAEGLFTQDIEMLNIPQTISGGVDQPAVQISAPPQPRAAIPELAAGTFQPCVHTPYDYNLIQGFTNSPADDPEFIHRVEEIAVKLGTLPEWLLAVMSFETAHTFSPSKRAANSSAVGLIQFTRATASGLGTSVDVLPLMSAVEQLEWVLAYFEDHLRTQRNKQKKAGLRPTFIFSSLEFLYTAVLAGLPQDNPTDTLITSTGKQFIAGTAIYNANSPIDYNNDGRISVGEATTQPAFRLYKGFVTIKKALANSGLLDDDTAKQLRRSGRLNKTFTDAFTQYQTAAGLNITGTLTDQLIRHLFKIDQPRTDNLCDEYDRLRDASYPVNQRHHNPLNIKKTKDGLPKWDGEIASETAFANFSSPELGLRAGYHLLRYGYYTRQKLTTVEQIISRWAPQKANKKGTTANYIDRVSTDLGVSPREPLNIDQDDQQLIDMVLSMARWEGGSEFEEYHYQVYVDGLRLLKSSIGK